MYVVVPSGELLEVRTSSPDHVAEMILLPSLTLESLTPDPHRCWSLFTGITNGHRSVGNPAR